MPVFTVYSYIMHLQRKHRQYDKPAVFTYYDEIVDWQDLKNNILHQSARNIYYEYERLDTQITVEKHLAGKYIRGTVNYRQSRIHYQRDPEFACRLIYKKHKDEILVKSPMFISPQFYQFKDDYEREVGKKWKPQPALKKGFIATLLNPDQAFNDLLQLKSLTYFPVPSEQYKAMQEKRRALGLYARSPFNLYAGSRVSLDRDRMLREGTHH